MGKLIYLAFEELPQRYTKMWNDAFISKMKENDIVIMPSNKESIINCGEFLDIFDTIKYKSQQIKEIAELFQKGIIKDNDVFFVPDIFYPSLEAIRYMSELANIKVKIVSFNHAGRADKTDFVQKLNKWADTQEETWHNLCDIVLCGSKFHANNIKRMFNIEPIVTGAIWEKEWMDKMCNNIEIKKENYVIYPHRICEEKDFELFLHIANNNKDIKFVICSGGNKKNVELPQNVQYRHNLTKKQYFEIFAKAKWYLSTAKQETFGYTLQEAIYFGCGVIVPNRACYKEYVTKDCLYEVDKMWDAPTLFAEMLKKEIHNNKQIEDNALKIYELCTTLKRD